MKVLLSCWLTAAAAEGSAHMTGENIGMLQVGKFAHDIGQEVSTGMDTSSVLQVVEERVKSLSLAVPDSEAHMSELDTILQLLAGFDQTIVNSHASDESGLETAVADVQTCNADFTSNKNTNDETKNVAQTSAGETHSSCRAIEKDLDDDRITKVGNLETFISGVASTESSFGCAVVDRAGNDQGQWFQKLENYVSTYKATWAQHEETASLAESAKSSKATECNGFQTAYETAFCTYQLQVHTTAGAYDVCYQDGQRYYDALVIQSQTRENVRQTEHTTISRIRCFVNHLKLNSSTPAECGGDVSMDDLTLAIPALPLKADIVPVVGYPGTEDFSYADLKGAEFTQAIVPCGDLPTWEHLEG